MNLKSSLRHLSTPVSANHQQNKCDVQPPSTTKNNPILKKLPSNKSLSETIVRINLTPIIWHIGIRADLIRSLNHKIAY
jgi:hypothetical protein